MGVQAGGPFLYKLQCEIDKANKKGSQTRNIQTRKETIGDALKHLADECRPRPGAPRAKIRVAIDFWAMFTGRQRTLSAQYYCPKDLVTACRHLFPWASRAQVCDQPIDKINDCLFAELERTRHNVAEAFPDDKFDLEMIVVMDNARVTPRAKSETRYERAAARAKAVAQHDRACEAIRKLFKDLGIKVEKQRPRPTAAEWVNCRRTRFSEDQQARENAAVHIGEQGTATQYYGPRHRRRFGKRTVTTALKPLVEAMRKTAWCKVPRGITIQDFEHWVSKQGKDGTYTTAEEGARGGSLQNTIDQGLGSERDFGIPSDEEAKSFRNTWPGFAAQQVTGKVTVVLSADEADLTILNWAEKCPDDARTIVLANDTDYAFFGDAKTLHYTLCYSTAVERRPWLVTDLAAAHVAMSSAFPTRHHRIIAALLAGHDYSGRGLRGVGLQTLHVAKLIRPTLAKTIEAMKAGKAPRWQRLAARLCKTTSEDGTDPLRMVIARGIKVLHTLHHDHLKRDEEESMRQAWDKRRAKAAEGTAIASTAVSTNPFSLLPQERRNILLDDKFTAEGSNRSKHQQRPVKGSFPLAETHAKQRAHSRNVARCPDLSYQHKVHPARRWSPAERVISTSRKQEEKRANERDPDFVAPIVELGNAETINTKAPDVPMYGEDDRDPAGPIGDESGDGDDDDHGSDDDEDGDAQEHGDHEGDGDDSEGEEGDAEASTGAKRKRPSTSTTAGRTSKKSKVTKDQDGKAKKPKKQIAARSSDLFETRTHCRWLPSALRDLHPTGEGSAADKYGSGHPGRNRTKTALDVVRLFTFGDLLAVRGCISPFAYEYHRRINSDPGLRYLFRQRNLRIDNGDNETQWYRDLLSLLAEDSCCRGRFVFQCQTSHHPTETIAASTEVIIGKWKEKHVETSYVDWHGEGKLRRVEADVDTIRQRFGLLHTSVVRFLCMSKWAGRFDLAMAEMMSDICEQGHTEQDWMPACPLPPMGGGRQSFDHGKRIFRAAKSTLKSWPMQQTLAGCVHQACAEAMSSSTASTRQKHEVFAMFYRTLVQTSVEDTLPGGPKYHLEDAVRIVAKETVEMASSQSHGTVSNVAAQSDLPSYVNGYCKGMLQAKWTAMREWLKEDLDPSVHHLTLKAIFSGTAKLDTDKGQVNVGLKHLKLFLLRLGHDFSFAYEPAFSSWNTERLVSVCNSECTKNVEKTAEWLDRWWLGDARGIAQRIRLAGRTVARSTSWLGVIDELGCFKDPGRASISTTLAAPHERLVVQPGWISSHKIWSAQVRAYLGDLNMDTARATRRLALFDVIFKRCIPKKEVWAGRFQTDGLNLRMASHSMHAICISKLESAFPEDVRGSDFPSRCASSGRLAGDMLEWICKSSRTTLETPEGITLDVHQAGKYLAPIPSSGSYIRKYLSGVEIKHVQSFAQSKTRNGIPTSIPKLCAESVADIRKVMDEHESRLDKHADWMIAGDDMGIKFAQAIHIEACASGTNPFEEPAADAESRATGTSKTLLFAPHELQEISKRCTRSRQAVLNTAPISLEVLREQSRADAKSHRSLLLSKLAMQQSEAYAKRGWLAVRQRKSVLDRLVEQFRKLAWNTAQPKRPLLFAIGDSCGLRDTKVKKHHVDASTSSMRYLVNKLQQLKEPVVFVQVDEAYTSQVCPNPTCKITASAEGDSDDRVGQRQRLAKLKFRDSGNICQRVQRCETCRTVYHRDLSAAMNISYVAWHLLAHGRHPWRSDAA